MPMNYDNNDFQGQKLHLAGEGSSKVFPVLLPYALPKFDFDDSLQGHLRFDSLVENEVFLGITSPEDNQWIDEYSRGNSRIQFSSSTAESRCNNVWSEATSSESVEMLLKSVGQEERVVEETIIEELDACDELDSLTNIMDPNLKQYDGKDAVICTHNALVPYEFRENICGSNVSSDCEQSHVGFASQSQESQLSSGELDSIVIGERCSLSVAEGKVERICDGVNQKEAENFENESFANELQENPCVSKVECENVGTSQNVDLSIEELKDRENPQQVSKMCIENASGLSKNFSSSEGDHIIKSKETSMDNPTDRDTIVETCTYRVEKPLVVSNVESVGKSSVEVSNPVNEEPTSLLPTESCNTQMAEGCDARVCSAEQIQESKCTVAASPICSKINQEFIDSMHEDLLSASPNGSIPVNEEPTSLLPIESCNMQITEGCDTHVCSAEQIQERKCTGVASPICSEINRELNASMHESLAVSPNCRYFKLQTIGDGNTKSEIPDSPKSNVGSLSKLSHVQNCSVEETENAIARDGEQLTSDASMVSVGNNLSEMGEGSDINNVCTSSRISCSSAELPAENISNEDVVAGNNAPKVHTGEFDNEESLPAKLSSSAQVDDEIRSEPGAICMDQGVTSSERGDARLSFNCSDMDVEVVEALDGQKNVEPSSSAKGCKHVIAMAQGSKSDTTVLTDPVAAVGSDGISTADTSDGVHLLSGSIATANNVTEDEPKSPILGVSLLNHDNEEKTEVVYSVAESSQDGTPQVESMVDCASEGPLPVVEKGTSPDHVHEMVGHYVPPVESCNPSPSEQAAKDNPGGLECSKTPETSSLPCSSSEKRGDNAEAVGLLDPKESIQEGHHRVEPLNLAVNRSDEQQTSGYVAFASECDANHMVQDGGGSASLDKPQIVSPSDTSSIELSLSAKDKQEASKGSMHENSPISKNTKVSSINSSGSLLDTNKLHEVSLGCSQTPNTATTQPVDKGNSERKPRRKSVGKGSAKKGDRLKETTPIRCSKQVEKSSALLTPPANGHAIQFEELKPNESVERVIRKASDVPPIPTSNLTDMNNSSYLFQKSFTDNQQVQLRAQILVYGSLISGAPPEEPHMVAAFGQYDGGRRAWEAAWRAYLERVHGQKSQAYDLDTPMQSRADLKDVGNKAPDQGVNVLSSPGGGASMGTPSPVVSPMIPLSSPLWNVSTPSDGLQSSAKPRRALLDYHQALSPLRPYQTPTMPNFSGYNPFWLSQGPFPGQWVASSPISAFNIGARLSASPTTEAVKLTTVKESGAPGISSIPVVHSTGPSVFPGSSSLSNVKRATVSSGQPSSDSKSRKRKKVTASGALSQISVPSQASVASVSSPLVHSTSVPCTEGYSQISFIAHNQTDSVTAPVLSSHFPESAAVSTPASTSKSNPGSFPSAVSPASTHDPSCGGQNEKTVISEETLSKVEQSKLQAEDAAARAADAVSHCQGVWSQLERQKNSGLVADDEAKLVSSAVSIAAAASIAKVAAAAAKIASNVAEQAKLMADEVFLSSRSQNIDQSSMTSVTNVVSKFDKATPASILKSGDRSNHPNLIISAAREAAQRRIEAASAASKHAENLDAIVKAAELAAEAVSQAGKIVGMGNPLPLRELVEAGPDGYWKTPQVTPNQRTPDKKNVEAAPTVSGIEVQTLKHGLSLQEDSGEVAENEMMVSDGISPSSTSHEDNTTARAHKGSDLSKTIEAIPESEIGSVHTSVVDRNMPHSASGTWKEHSFKEGCLVEVFKDDNKYKGAWFSANILSLKDGKAFVCYTEIQSDEGSGQLKEWIPLEVEGTEVPRVRIAHPMTTMRFEGTRKRRRTAVTNYAWCSGDRVDVWTLDCWREGVVIETNKIDATSLTVQVPAQGETSIVRSWNVRPTLIWKDGKWIEWSSLKGNRSSQGDTPQRKRPKLGGPIMEDRGKDTSLKNIDLVDSGRHEVSRVLPLSAQENSFNIGKKSRDENKLNTHKTMRSGLQKEGPRVIFGVPKPGKKQKFMDVSKHYIGDRSNKNNTPNDSVKFTRYLIPQAPGARGWKNNFRSDAKEKQVAEAETKSRLPKSRKPPVPSARTLAQKDKNSNSAKSKTGDGVMIDRTVRDCVSVDENVPSHQNQMEFGSSSNAEDATEGPASREVSTSKVKPERLNKGKGTSAGRKTAKVEAKAQVVEPRKSNRRIQPTSRLLEGLQSSLTISKIPTVSHGSQRGHKVASKGNASHG